MKYFSSSTLGFYSEDNKPKDGIEISDETWQSLLDGAAVQSKWITADSKGNPVLTDPPEPTQAESVQMAENRKANLMAAAAIAIAPLQDAVELDEATDEEKLQLNAWKKYRVLLNRQETSAAPDIEWPEKPLY